jgi:hypothetical protein
MEKFIGTKIIKAKPMNRLEYNNYRGWELPSDENGSDEGFLVEYIDGGKSNHPEHSGYISWSPKEVFEKAYRPTNGMTFGQAIEALKNGHRVARSGWNGKSMFLYYVSEGNYPAKMPSIKGFFPSDNIPYVAYVAMKTAQNNVVPWLASQTDILSEDWYIV